MRHLPAFRTLAALCSAAGAMAPVAPLQADTVQPVDRAPASTLAGAFDRRGDLLVHRASGMTFPAEVGNVRRVSERVFSDAGDYVGVRYRVPLSNRASALVQIGMVELPGMAAREHYFSRRAIVLNRLARPRPLTEAPLDELDFDNFYGRFTNGREVEGLITAQFGDWGVRAETEYPADREAEAHKAITAFLLGLDWRPLREGAAAGER